MATPAKHEYQRKAFIIIHQHRLTKNYARCKIHHDRNRTLHLQQKAVIDDFVAARNDLYTKNEVSPTGKISGTSSIKL